jgi:hypothetical protein
MLDYVFSELIEGLVDNFLDGRDREESPWSNLTDFSICSGDDGVVEDPLWGLTTRKMLDTPFIGTIAGVTFCARLWGWAALRDLGEGLEEGNVSELQSIVRVEHLFLESKILAVATS